jgi:hypothetical protein
MTCKKRGKNLWEVNDLVAFPLTSAATSSECCGISNTVFFEVVPCSKPLEFAGGCTGFLDKDFKLVLSTKKASPALPIFILRATSLEFTVSFTIRQQSPFCAGLFSLTWKGLHERFPCESLTATTSIAPVVEPW